jgi:hypothetical protein
MTEKVKQSDVDSRMQKSLTSMYHREMWIETLENYKDNNIFNNTVKDNSRKLVEKLFKISVPMQLSIEDYLNNKIDLSPLKIPEIQPLMHHDWVDYYQTYNMEIPKPKDLSEIPKLTITSANQSQVYTCSKFYLMI